MGLKFLSKASYISVFVIFIAFLSSCNEDPSTLGYSFIQDTVSIETLTDKNDNIIAESIPYKIGGSVNNGGALLLGKTEEGLKSLCILRATPVDTLGYITEEDISGVSFSFYPQRYSIGDTLKGHFGFNIKKVTKAWTFDAEYDSLMVAPADYFDDEIIASHEGLITFDDSTGISPIVMNLPKNIIAQWLQNWGKRLDGDTIPAWGLAMIPDENTDVMYQFSAMGSGRDPAYPINFITVFYTNDKDELDTLKMYFSIESFFPTAPQPDEGSIAIQGSIMYYTQLMCDVSMIPTLAGVQKSELELTLDRSRSSWGNYGLNRTIRCELVENRESEDYIAYFEGYKDTTKIDKYVFQSISSAVTHWQRTGGAGFLVFKPATFQNSIHEADRIVFYGPDAEDPENRPKLKIIYSNLSNIKK